MFTVYEENILTISVISNMKIEGFTISYAFDGGNSRKSSSFVSVNFKLPEPLGLDEVEVLRTEASKKVTMWAIQDALMRGEISQDDAKERLDVIKHNFDSMKLALEKRSAK